MAERILVIEDSEDYRIMLEACLGSEFDLTVCKDGSSAIEQIQKKPFDLFIVDIVLPDLSGFQICSFIRSQEKFENTPILILTGKSSADDQITGYDIGVDDYVTKPFHHGVLLAKVKGRLRRSSAKNKKRLSVPGYSIDSLKQIILPQGYSEPLELTRIEFRLFTFFAQRIDHVVGRQQILQNVWPDNLNLSERTVDSHISNLRKKLAGTNGRIEAVHGCGYRFSLDETSPMRAS